jgi:putative ABC transport system permease protein
MLIFSLAGRNATRNVTRTILTAGMVVLGTALLTVALSWQQGIFGQMLGNAANQSGEVRVVQKAYVEREDLMPLYENIPNVAATATEIAKVPGVKEVYPRVVVGVTGALGDTIGEVFGMAVGIDSTWIEHRVGISAGALEGRVYANDDEMVVGARLAHELGVKIGDEVVLDGQTQDGAMSAVKGKVVGILRTGTPMIDQQAFMSLGKVQYLADLTDASTEILVYGDDRDHARQLAAAVADSPGAKGFVVQAWSEREPYKTILSVVGVVKSVIAGIIVFITALGVWNTMMMSVLERTGEIGVMRAMGLSRLGAVMLFVVEALVIAVMGGAVGVGIGSIGAGILQYVGVELGDGVTGNISVPLNSHMYAHLTPDVVITGFVLALCMAVVGSAPPALRAASIQPVAAMRSRR